MQSTSANHRFHCSLPDTDTLFTQQFLVQHFLNCKGLSGIFFLHGWGIRADIKHFCFNQLLASAFCQLFSEYFKCFCQPQLPEHLVESVTIKLKHMSYFLLSHAKQDLLTASPSCSVLPWSKKKVGPTPGSVISSECDQLKSTAITIWSVQSYNTRIDYEVIIVSDYRTVINSCLG